MTQDTSAQIQDTPTKTAADPSARSTPVAKRVVFAAIAVVLILILIEGCSGYAMFGFELVFRTKPADEITFRQYDEQLGWVNAPNVELIDHFGPGGTVITNSQGLREDHEIDTQVPPDKIRVVCSGDSFAFATGVGNDQTWEHFLSQLDSRIEPVNLGTAAYGIGQMYLWYKRAGQPLDHDIHIFMFITNDFERMVTTSFVGYPKPIVKLVDDQLTTLNVPVPQKSFIKHWMTQNASLFRRLNTFNLISKVIEKSRPQTSSGQTGPSSGAMRLSRAEMEQTFRAIVADLKRVNEEKSSTLVLVHVPLQLDYNSNISSSLRGFVGAICRELGVVHMDLIDDLRQLDPATVDSLYLKDHEVIRPYAARHFNVEGNRYLAQTLYRRMMGVPEIKEKLENASP